MDQTSVVRVGNEHSLSLQSPPDVVSNVLVLVPEVFLVGLGVLTAEVCLEELRVLGTTTDPGPAQR